jgi:hypothetical protein
MPRSPPKLKIVSPAPLGIITRFALDAGGRVVRLAIEHTLDRQALANPRLPRLYAESLIMNLLPLPSNVFRLPRQVVWPLVIVAVLMPATFVDSSHAFDAATEHTTDAKTYADRVRPLLAKYCVDCHGPETHEAELRLDQLAPTFDVAVGARWRRVLERVELGQMPPDSEPRPTADEALVLTSWIKDELRGAELARRTKEGRVVFRRLNRVEYQNTVRDLLGVEVDLKELLPPDTSSDGFDNVGEALHTSSFLMDRYLESADTALALAISNRPRPPLLQKRIDCREERQVQNATQPVFRQTDDAVVFFSSSPWSSVLLRQFHPADRGRYRIRISAYAVQSKTPVTLRVVNRPELKGLDEHLIGYFDVPPGKPTVIEFVELFELRDSLILLPSKTGSAKTIMDAGGAEKYEGRGVAIQWIDVEGPLLDSWPPESHCRIFGDAPQAAIGVRARSPVVEVTSEDPAADSRRILRDFASRAFRRNVTEEELKRVFALIESKRGDGYSFEQAVRVGLKAIMVAPRFVFLDETPGRLDDWALASRLSYFLWSTMPDKELLTLAEQRKLSQPEVLRAQVERMLADPKSDELTKNFVGQWLKLREIDATSPDHRLYPEFDDMLKQAMLREVELFFDEVLKSNLSLTNFTASDFTFVNQRLAKHYGIEGIQGQEMQRVSLPPQSHRGGVMTMAAVLKVTANGTSTSPVYRGAFVLDRLLGTPPAQPPDGVTGLEPDIRGATTIREQLSKHRELTSCRSCHAKMDPPGFALESFDVIGGWRENYRSVGNGNTVVIDGQRMRYSIGPPITPGDVLADGRRFADIDELKQLLLTDKDQLARGLAGKLITYATGRAPDMADEPQIERIVGKVREQNYGFRSLVHEVVQSEVFQTK